MSKYLVGAFTALAVWKYLDTALALRYYGEEVEIDEQVIAWDLVLGGAFIALAYIISTFF